MVTKIILGIFLVLVIIYLVPMVVYGIFSSLIGAKMPEGVSPLMFLLSVLVSKLGTAIAFVVIFYLARNIFGNNWFLYALLWWVMFAVGEIGQAIGPNYSWKEAVAGIISEAIYFPAAVYLLRWLLRV